MLVEGLVTVVLHSAGTKAPRPPVRLAMAAALIGANGQKQYEPPTIETVPTPSTPPSPGVLSAPPPQQGIASTPLVPEQPGVPVQGKLPAPLAGSERMQMAQAAPSNSEILQRLDRLEQENQRLRKELEASKGQPALPAVPNAPPRGQAPAQMVSGWRVSLYPWNPDGYVTGSPLAVFNVRNQRFDAALGQRPLKLDRRYQVDTGRNATNEMFVYRFEGWLHVTRPGRHEIGFDVTCGLGHPCNLVVKIGGVQLINIRRQNLENKILLAGLDLTPSDYQVEVTFGLANNRFVKFDPHNKVLFYPLYRPPGEYNLRDFGPGELLTESNPSIPYGPPAR
ncbi:metallophosphoesterase family protein [Xanthobacter wiegelii]|uniref:hypothetical protein n=1 Tax=Xanthobacter wiegelii TaxID=3119913 RepID=UPI00372C79B2